MKNEITPSSLEKLARDHTDGQIGKMIGLSAESVRQRRLKYNIPAKSRKSFDPGKEKLELMYQKMSMRKIADKFGVGETVVWKRLKEYGIKLKDHEKGGHRLKKGKKFSDKHLENLRKANAKNRGKYVGKNNPNWKGGLSEINARARRSGQYATWKKKALEAADYKCQECGVEHRKVCECCGVKVSLHVHHIKPFAKYPELRYEQSNAEVLCPKCHYCKH